MPLPFETKPVVRPAALRLLEHRDRPLARDQRLVVGADDDARAQARARRATSCSGEASQRRRHRGRIAQRLRRHPVLAVAAVQIAAEHAEAVGERARDARGRTASSRSDRTARRRRSPTAPQPSALVEAHLADADARPRAAGSSGRTRSSAAARRAAFRRARPRASRAQGRRQATAWSIYCTTSRTQRDVEVACARRRSRRG